MLPTFKRSPLRPSSHRTERYTQTIAVSLSTEQAFILWLKKMFGTSRHTPTVAYRTGGTNWESRHGSAIVRACSVDTISKGLEPIH